MCARTATPSHRSAQPSPFCATTASMRSAFCPNCPPKTLRPSSPPKESSSRRRESRRMYSSPPTAPNRTGLPQAAIRSNTARPSSILTITRTTRASARSIWSPRMRRRAPKISIRSSATPDSASAKRMLHGFCSDSSPTAAVSGSRTPLPTPSARRRNSWNSERITNASSSPSSARVRNASSAWKRSSL